MREESRGVWLWPWLEAVWQDAKVALRGLRKSPAFTAGVRLTFVEAEARSHATVRVFRRTQGNHARNPC